MGDETASAQQTAEDVEESFAPQEDKSIVSKIKNAIRKTFQFFFGSCCQFDDDDFDDDDMNDMENVELEFTASDVFEFTFDPNTIHKKLYLANNNKKVIRQEGKVTKYPKHPDRFKFWPLVLSNESYAQSGYWEVECTGKAHIGVTYIGIERIGEGDNSMFGYNNKSWGLMFQLSPEGNLYHVRHRRKRIEIPITPSDTCNRIGVYLDYPGGRLSFYKVSTETRTLLHTFRIKKFKEPVYAGFGLSKDSSLVLCPPDQINTTIPCL